MAWRRKGLQATVLEYLKLSSTRVSSSPPEQNGRRFANDISRCIFLNENICRLIKISLKSVPKGPIANNPALV